MKLFGKKDSNPPAPQGDAVDDLGDVDAGFEEEGAAPAAPLIAPSRRLAAGGAGSRKAIMLLAALGVLVVLGGGYLWFMGQSEEPAIHVTATESATPPQPASDASAMPAADPSAAPGTAVAAADPLASAPAPVAAGTPPMPAAADPLMPPADPAAVVPVMPASDQAIANAGAPDAQTPPANGAPPAPGQPTDPFAAPPATEPAATAPTDTANVAVTADPAAAALGAPPADDAVPADDVALDAPATADGAPPQPAPGAPVVAAPGEAAPDWATPGTAVVPGTSNPAAKPTAPNEAELAIVQHADVIDQLSRPADAVTKSVTTTTTVTTETNTAASNADAAKTVAEILEQKGIVRPLPSGYMTIRKESNGGNVDSRLTSARTALAQRRNTAALQLFDELHHDYPKDRRVLMGRAVSLQKLGQTDEALAAYEAVLNRDPKNVDALNNMLGLLKKKDPQLALAKLQELHDAYPYQADITAQLGVAYASTGQYDLALRYLDMADSEKPGMGLVLYNKSVLLDKMGRSREAAALYRQVLRLAADGELGVEVPVDSIRRRLAALQ